MQICSPNTQARKPVGTINPTTYNLKYQCHKALYQNKVQSHAKRDLDSCTSIPIDDYLFIDSFGYNALCICLCFLLNFVASSIGYGKPAGKKNPHGYGYGHEIIPATGMGFLTGTILSWRVRVWVSDTRRVCTRCHP